MERFLQVINRDRISSCKSLPAFIFFFVMEKRVSTGLGNKNWLSTVDTPGVESERTCS